MFKKEKLKARPTKGLSSRVPHKTREKELTRFGIHLERAANTRPEHGSLPALSTSCEGARRSELRNLRSLHPRSSGGRPASGRLRAECLECRCGATGSLHNEQLPSIQYSQPNKPSASAPKKGCLCQRGGERGEKKNTVRFTGVVTLEPFCDVKGRHGALIFSQ